MEERTIEIQLDNSETKLNGSRMAAVFEDTQEAVRIKVVTEKERTKVSSDRKANSCVILHVITRRKGYPTIGSLHKSLSGNNYNNVTHVHLLRDRVKEKYRPISRFVAHLQLSSDCLSILLLVVIHRQMSVATECVCTFVLSHLAIHNIGPTPIQSTACFGLAFVGRKGNCRVVS